MQQRSVHLQLGPQCVRQILHVQRVFLVVESRRQSREGRRVLAKRNVKAQRLLLLRSLVRRRWNCWPALQLYITVV